MLKAQPAVGGRENVRGSSRSCWKAPSAPIHGKEKARQDGAKRGGGRRGIASSRDK